MSAAPKLEPVTAHGLIAGGLVFIRDPERGNAIVNMKGAKSLYDAARAEIAARAEAMQRLIPTADAIVPLLVIAAKAPNARSGYCLSCSDPMDAHRSGQCELCEAALGKALRAAGRL